MLFFVFWDVLFNDKLSTSGIDQIVYLLFCCKMRAESGSAQQKSGIGFNNEMNYFIIASIGFYSSKNILKTIFSIIPFFSVGFAYVKI
jgi:hypothetical protein